MDKIWDQLEEELNRSIKQIEEEIRTVFKKGSIRVQKIEPAIRDERQLGSQLLVSFTANCGPTSRWLQKPCLLTIQACSRLRLLSARPSLQHF
jgi:hypothetical protein